LKVWFVLEGLVKPLIRTRIFDELICSTFFTKTILYVKILHAKGEATVQETPCENNEGYYWGIVKDNELLSGYTGLFGMLTSTT
jgi:hypothetical protein